MWPDGKRCAVSFTFDFDAEEVWLAEEPENAQRPGPLSQGRYGAKVAVPLLLDMLRAHDVPATFFVPGRVAEMYPERVREILAAGHEVAHHGYTHRSPAGLGADEERRELRAGLRALTALGADVQGYRAPSWDLNAQSLQLLEEEGFRYSSNLMDDIRPYRRPDSYVAEIPVHWILDDAAHFWFDADSWTKKISTVEEVRAIWDSEFQGIRRLGGCCVFTMHPQIIGRPGRLPLLEWLLSHVTSQPDVWVATCRDIADRTD